MSPPEIRRFAGDIRHVPGRDVLGIHGELDVATAGELGDTVAELRCTTCSDVVVDLRAVPFIDSSASAVLVRADEQARSQGRGLAVADGCPALEHLLTVANLSTHFERV